MEVFTIEGFKNLFDELKRQDLERRPVGAFFLGDAATIFNVNDYLEEITTGESITIALTPEFYHINKNTALSVLN